jgi:dinuclear metal center YbgI/SA1388 family protein
MKLLKELRDFLNQFAPRELAEDWDNVGLLVGDSAASIERVMTCLTITPPVVAEAVERKAGLIVSHHPLPFRPVRRITADTTVGRMLLDLISARVAVYSPHTAFDSAAGGINQQLAEGLGLTEIAPLKPFEEEGGSGRLGRFAEAATVARAAARLKDFLSIERLQIAGPRDRPVSRAAVACGAAGSFLEDAIAAGCDLFVTGETSFHTCLEADARGVTLLLISHYASERFAVVQLAERLATEFPSLAIWASERDKNPLAWV